MKKHLIHRNLNTSFVDLPALVTHLRNLEFAGVIHIELSSYEATIIFTPGNALQAREFDHTTGKSCEGENALVRILRRSSEPCGLIHVYQSETDVSPPYSNKVFVDKAISSFARRTVSGRNETLAKYAESDGQYFRPFIPSQYCGGKSRYPRTSSDLPELPFALRALLRDYCNNLGESQQDWLDLLSITAELLRTIDGSLAKEDVNFAEAFRAACAIVSSDYPFIDPDAGIFCYRNGQVSFRTQLAGEPFADGVTAALAHVFERLSEQKRLRKIYHFTRHRVRLLIEKRKADFDRLGMTKRLDGVLRREPQ